MKRTHDDARRTSRNRAAAARAVPRSRLGWRAIWLLLVVLSATLASCGGSEQPHGLVSSESRPSAKAPDAARELVIARGTRLPTLDGILEREVFARYHRDRPRAVLDDLRERCGLAAAVPRPLDDAFRFDLAGGRYRVREILQRLAAQGGLQLETRDGSAVFWCRVDPGRLAELARTLKDPRARDRCGAVEQLTRLADPAIYPLLFWAMAEGSEPMALAAVRGLDAQHRETLRFAEGFEPFAAGIARLLTVRPEREVTPLISLSGATRSPRCGQPLLPLLRDPRHQAHVVRCLGQTRDPRAVPPLLELLETASPADPEQDSGVPPASRSG